MNNEKHRMARELKTVEAMIDLYCHHQHGPSNGLCPGCEALRDYARQRLQKCPFQENKTTCAKCPIHCYKPELREQIRAVMRYAGPRMLYHHPVLALQHLADGRRKDLFHSPEAGPARAGDVRKSRP
jgi:hypothetical protein